MKTEETTELQTVEPEELDNTYSYPEYRDHVESRLNDHRSTGENHSEEMLHYSKMNLFRMKRLDRFMELSEPLRQRIASVRRPMEWVVLTEGWCGDAAQTLPCIYKISEQSDRIRLRLVLRDKHPDLIQRFLTNGNSRSIPKLICLDAETREVLGTWGPRPETAQSLNEELRSDEDVSVQERAERLHKWYTDNRCREVEQEFLALIDDWDG